MPDGSVQVYDLPDGATASPSKLFLTKIVDPHVIGRFKTSHLWAVQNQPPEVGLVHIWLTVFFKSKFRFL
jgi:hypothetical protein